jgi:hypothetical protein
MANATPKLTYNPNEEGRELKMSKSSFVLYNMCPRKYWWNYIALPDMRPPPTREMVRGSAVHKAMEPLIEAPKNKQKIKKADKTIVEEGFGGDFGYDVMKELLSDLEDQIGPWKLLQAEMKMTVYDERKDIWLVGAIDGLLETEDGEKVILVELKTGNMNDGKLSRTRRELAYYTYMLNLIGDWPMPTHFLYIAPDAINEKTLNKLMKQKKKVVGCGLTQGMYVMEPISLRTVNAFMKVYDTTVDSLKTREWPMKWNDYFCTQYCDYVVQCEPEELGLCPDPTKEVVA